MPRSVFARFSSSGDGDGEDAAEPPFPERHVAREDGHGGHGGQNPAFADDGRRGDAEERVRHPFHLRERRPPVLGDLLVVPVEEDAVRVEEKNRPRVELLRLVRRPVVESLRVLRVEEPLRAGLVRHARDLPAERVLVAPLIGAKDPGDARSGFRGCSSRRPRSRATWRPRRLRRASGGRGGRPRRRTSSRAPARRARRPASAAGGGGGARPFGLA